MGRRIIVIVVALFSIAGCSSQLVNQINYSKSSSSSEYLEMRQVIGSGYLINIPFHKRFSRTERSFFTASYPIGIDPNKLKSEDYSIAIIDSSPEISEWNPNCSPILTGAPEVEELPLDLGKAAWGGVDYSVVYPLMDHAEGQPEPLCPPETPFTGSYAFCSEYEGKTVVICINQQTDNPAMAAEIFRTFQWLPEDQRSSSSSS